jgi:hypothetical protein
MQATSFAILFWTPLLLDAILSGRFGGGAAPPPPPPRSEREQARRTERHMPPARWGPTSPSHPPRFRNASFAV